MLDQYLVLINQLFGRPVQALPKSLPATDPLQLLRHYIDVGGYAPGDRLPAERELINASGIARNLLRKGLDAHEREGKT